MVIFLASKTTKAAGIGCERADLSSLDPNTNSVLQPVCLTAEQNNWELLSRLKSAAPGRLAALSLAATSPEAERRPWWWNCRKLKVSSVHVAPFHTGCQRQTEFHGDGRLKGAIRPKISKRKPRIWGQGGPILWETERFFLRKHLRVTCFLRWHQRWHHPLRCSFHISHPKVPGGEVLSLYSAIENVMGGSLEAWGQRWRAGTYYVFFFWIVPLMKPETRQKNFSLEHRRLSYSSRRKLAVTSSETGPIFLQ